MRFVVAALALAGAAVFAVSAVAQDKFRTDASAQIDYRGFRGLTAQVEAYRADRLVSLADFQRMAREPNTIVLDARSADAYREGHIGGAINLPFTDFHRSKSRCGVARSERAHPDLLQQQFFQ
jgi:phage shock protein E